MQASTKPTKPQTKNSKKRNLIAPGDPLMSLKRVLDQILAQAELIPEAVKQNLVSARDAVWEQVRSEEEKINSRTR